MATAILTQKLDVLRGKIDAPHVQPKDLHDEVRIMVDILKTSHEPVPADLREAIEALEAEILEEFYDNLPV